LGSRLGTRNPDHVRARLLRGATLVACSLILMLGACGDDARREAPAATPTPSATPAGGDARETPHLGTCRAILRSVAHGNAIFKTLRKRIERARTDGERKALVVSAHHAFSDWVTEIRSHIAPARSRRVRRTLSTLASALDEATARLVTFDALTHASLLFDAPAIGAAGRSLLSSCGFRRR
jgi:hypothetical protein